MEEILASIRRIISDDTAEDTDTPNTEAGADSDIDMIDVEAEATDEFETVEDETPSQEVDFDALSDDGDIAMEDIEPDDDDVLELTDVVETEPEPEISLDEGLGDISFEDIEEVGDDMDVGFGDEAAGEVEFVDIAIDDEPAAVEEEAPVAADGRPLISNDTDSSVAAAFGTLASTLLARDGTSRTLEDLVQELLRPMLKSWLDENLPAVVEDLVRQEIERVARRSVR